MNALLSESETEIVVRAGPARGTRLVIEPRREKYYWSGVYEPAVQEVVVRFAMAGATVWDVGAHIGFFTALAARCVGGDGQVHAFEPMPTNRARLNVTVERNRLANVSVHAVAIAGQSGTCQLYEHPATSMWSICDSGSGSGIEVACVTLDELLLSQRFGVPVLVKVDAEGAEASILASGVRLAETEATFVVEFNEDQSVADARSVLWQHSFVRLTSKHWLVRRR